MIDRIGSRGSPTQVQQGAALAAQLNGFPVR